MCIVVFVSAWVWTTTPTHPTPTHPSPNPLEEMIEACLPGIPNIINTINIINNLNRGFGVWEFSNTISIRNTIDIINSLSLGFRAWRILTGREREGPGANGRRRGAFADWG